MEAGSELTSLAHSWKPEPPALALTKQANEVDNQTTLEPGVSSEDSSLILDKLRDLGWLVGSSLEIVLPSRALPVTKGHRKIPKVGGPHLPPAFQTLTI